MRTHARRFATLVAAGSLLALPGALAAGPAGATHKGTAHSQGAGGQNKGQGTSRSAERSKRCRRPHVMRGFVVRGTLVSATADDPRTAADETAIVIRVRSANRHARRSGELADQDAGRRGVQVRGAEYAIGGGDDGFRVRLRGYEGADAPSAGDAVRVYGRIKLTRKRCAAPGTSLADRYAAPDLRTVTIRDRDPDE